MRNEIEQLITDNTIEHLIIDMSNIHFIDSSGIGMLVALKIKMTNKNKTLFLLNPTDQALTTLDVVQLTNFFQIISGEDDLLTTLPE